MTVFDASKNARTEDFQAGDIGYIEVSRAHYIENTGDEDLVFLEVFPDSRYQDISTAQWLERTLPLAWSTNTCTPAKTSSTESPKKEAIIVPL